MNVRLVNSSEKLFLSPRQGSNRQPSDDRLDILTMACKSFLRRMSLTNVYLSFGMTV